MTHDDKSQWHEKLSKVAEFFFFPQTHRCILALSPANHSCKQSLHASGVVLTSLLPGKLLWTQLMDSLCFQRAHSLFPDQDAPSLSRLRARKSGGRAIRSNSHSVTYAQLLMTCHNENKLAGCRYAITMLPQGMTAHKHHMAHHQRLAMRLGVSHCLCVC